MNFEFSNEHNLLRDQARSFLAKSCPISRVRQVLESDETYAEDVWREMVDLGWTAIAIPEEFGGDGFGQLELCVIAEELGRTLAPTPFSSSVYLATEALMQFGSEAQKKNWLPKLASGDVIGTLAVAEGPREVTAQNIQCGFEGGKLTGIKYPVPDGVSADFAIALAGDSMVVAELKNTKRENIDVVDPSRKHAKIDFGGCSAELLGAAGEGWSQLNRLYDRAAVLFAFEQVGGAHSALEMAREYAMGRYAFGRPIGSFQAIKHKLANMFIDLTLAHSNAYYGAWALSTDDAELPVAAAAARVSATTAFHNCSKENIQTHGGNGFTWEFDCHLYYRRSKLLSLNLGGPHRWKDRLVTNIENSAKTQVA